MSDSLPFTNRGFPARWIKIAVLVEGGQPHSTYLIQTGGIYDQINDRIIPLQHELAVNHRMPVMPNEVTAEQALKTQHLPLAWGLQPPPEARLAWGARAIYKLTSTSTVRQRGRVVSRARTAATIDILHDRQSAAGVPGVTDTERRAFERWINKTAIPALHKLCVRYSLTSDSEGTISIASDGYQLDASPRASYGYLYIVAWKVASADDEINPNDAESARRDRGLPARDGTGS